MDAATRERRYRAITRTSVVAGVANLFLGIFKIGAGIVGQSYALIVDGIHSLSDLLSDFVVWFVGRKATRAPDLEHPYGHARYETVVTLVLGIALAVVAISITYDAVRRLFEPDTLLIPGVIALWAAALSILIKEALYWYTLKAGEKVGSTMLRANAWHHRTDAISSVVVLVGVAGSIAGLNYLDAVSAILVALMIAKIAWDLVWEAIRELVDTGLSRERLAKVQDTIRAVPGVRDVHMLRTRKLGGQAAADVHVLVDPRLSVSEGHMISQIVEDRLKARIDEIIDVTVHIDPEDDEDGSRSVGLPPRAEALDHLARRWASIPAAASRQRIVLHYLDGRIQVEVYFPLSAYSGRETDAQRLADDLSRALISEPVFERVTIYFGGDAH
ncbi:cation diffusion facilitator family transporter [Thioalkalicoccus limnaeus]|uniref:Cation diffusion facilitator family transporter n=1 Tax=Thioalkalicoccus limnaeus TaxID=120681 RepID=A0ABV4BDX7_9GAMM